MIRLLMFDLDGTLIDSAEDYRAAANRLLLEEGKRELSLPEIMHGLGHGLRQLIQKLFPEVPANDEFFVGLLHKFQSYYEENCHNHTALYPGALEFLENWDGELALITNKNYAPTMKILNKLDLMKLEWAAIYGFDSLPERKPHPMPLLEALKITGFEPHQALMIGDSPPDILAAQSASVRVAAVDFGYTDTSILKPLNPSAFFSSYTELPDLIARLNESGN